MESANLHHQHHQLQDQFFAGSSPLATPSCYGVAGSTLSWTPNTILNPSSNFSPNSNGSAIINSRNPRQPNDILVPSLINSTTSMIQDSSGFQWASNSNNNNNNNNAGTFTSHQSAAHDFHLERIKGELSDSYQKFAQMIHNSSSSSPPSIIDDFQLQHTNYIKIEQSDHLNDLSEEKALLLRNFSSGCQISELHHQLPAGDHFYSGAQNLATPSRGDFSQIFPTINISNLNHSSSSVVPSSLDMNMQALDLFRHNVNLGVYKDSLSYGGLDHHMQQSSHRLLNSPSKISLFASGGAAEAKRPSSFLEPKAAQKKSRSDSRASCPPFKVRKEKLGDRIAALQQLVAPFGKTDTASVLMEAIGYIKFLQNQVETLSVPYMKSSRNKASRTMRGGSAGEDGNEERKRDLRSRGLCLVPLSCLSYVTDACGGVWPPPTFGAGT